jgi:SAM-dependent methyltransferase
VIENLEQVRKSYDEAIGLGKQGIDPYQRLPDYITKDPDYPIYQKSIKESLIQGNDRKIIYEYLSPIRSNKFIDFGCNLNLMFRGYDKWASSYYGIDISSEAIRLLESFIIDKNINVDSLICGSIHETPYAKDCFDIGACIGVLEYFEEDFVKKAICEANRIMKPDSRFVLDIPNIGHPACRIMMMIEELLGRPDKFNMSAKRFEEIISPYFNIFSIVNDQGMLCYFLECKE